MLNRFIDHIKSQNLFSSGESLLIAVSGGVDSMVLAALIEASGFSYSVVHVDHHTRAGKSSLDSQFVNEYFTTKDIKVHNLDFKYQGKGNFHDLAHKARYRFFMKLGYDRILTAHHKDDYLETVLVNVFNGRSLDGILTSHETVVRPLLPFSKAEILEYARKNSISYVEDESNSENTYLRNLIRNSVLPLFKEKNDLDSKIINLSKRTSADLALLKELIKDQLTVSKENGIYRISLLELNKVTPTYLFHALSEYGVNRTQAFVLQGMLSKVGKEILTYSHQIIVDRDDLIIKPILNEPDGMRVVKLEHFPIEIKFSCYTLSFSKVSELPTKFSLQEGYFPMRLISDELVIRRWEDGDYIHPYGMGGKTKKLKSLFNDQKVDRITKSLLPIILNQEDIIWVPTLRSDERYKVSSSDREILRITISS